MAGAIGRGFITVKLQQIEGHRVQNLTQLAATGIDEQADRGDEGWQGRDYGPRLGQGHRARAGRIEHQTNGIGTGRRGCQGVLNTGNAADLASNH